jgi:hypothetical protein
VFLGSVETGAGVSKAATFASETASAIFTAIASSQWRKLNSQ